MKIEKTFNDWNKAGFKIIKGSKSIGRNADGECLFTIDQVERLNSTLSQFHEPILDSIDRANAQGTPHGVVENFDSLVREASRMPDLHRKTVFSVNNSLEQHFLNVADKHEIVDKMFDEYDDDY